MRALIVDDSRYIRSYLRSILEEQGAECVEAENGQLALVAIEEADPCDLALVDVNMPVMGGLECNAPQCKDEASENSDGDRGSRPQIDAALEAGADEYLMKPFNEAALMEKLRMIGIG